jgi:hypothetical protein
MLSDAGYDRCRRNRRVLSARYVRLDVTAGPQTAEAVSRIYEIEFSRA